MIGGAQQRLQNHAPSTLARNLLGEKAGAYTSDGAVEAVDAEVRERILELRKREKEASLRAMERFAP